MYLIRNYDHRRDLTMGAHGFSIDLSPQWKEMVAQSSYTQQHMDTLISTMGRQWLDCCGFDADFDPDNCGAWADKKLPPGPNTRKLYEPHTSIRIAWGEWGPEHISVPGNACGLDIDRGGFGSFFERPSNRLLPHNVDSWTQKYLLTIIFCFIAESIVLEVTEKGIRDHGSV